MPTNPNPMPDDECFDRLTKMPPRPKLDMEFIDASVKELLEIDVGLPVEIMNERRTERHAIQRLADEWQANGREADRLAARALSLLEQNDEIAKEVYVKLEGLDLPAILRSKIVIGRSQAQRESGFRGRFAFGRFGRGLGFFSLAKRALFSHVRGSACNAQQRVTSSASAHNTQHPLAS